MVEEIFLLNYEETNIIKHTIANILYEKNIPQSKIAKLLKLSQPMVSLYLKNKKNVNNEINEISKKIVEKFLSEKNVNFQTCISFSNKNLKGNFFLANKNEILSDENSKILENLKKAFYNIKEKDISGLIPEVKINIAMTKKNLNSPDDVASFLDGLIIADKKITGYNGIRFGRSKHLSSILLDHGKNLEKKAIMNIAYNKNLDKTNFKIGFLTKDFDLRKSNSDYDILVHKGDFGIEPCAYILGNDALDVSNKLLKILGEINEK